MTESLQLTQHVQAPAERVWEAISTPEGVASWWAPGDLRAEVGRTFTLDMGGWGRTPCTVLAVEPSRRITYSFDPARMGWVMDWRLEPVADGTTVHLEHSGFDLDDPGHRHAYEQMGAGWRDQVLPRLAEVCAAG